MWMSWSAWATTSSIPRACPALCGSSIRESLRTYVSALTIAWKSSKTKTTQCLVNQLRMCYNTYKPTELHIKDYRRIPSQVHFWSAHSLNRLSCITLRNKIFREQIKRFGMKCKASVSLAVLSGNTNAVFQIILLILSCNRIPPMFDDYKKTIDPLNRVVHRPAEFQLDSKTLIELPRKGLLTFVNYTLSSE